MTPGKLIETRRGAWDRLEALVRKAGRRGAGRLTETELHELVRLYPAVAVDVARTRMLGADPAVQRRVNSLALAAHGMLYRRKHVRPFRAVMRFLWQDYPRLFRGHWAAMCVALAVFLVGALGAYVTVRIHPATAYIFMPQGLEADMDGSAVTAGDVSERYRRMSRPPMASGIIANNISVSFFAFAFGITAGLGTCYVLLMNSMMLGTFFGHFANNRLSYVCWSFLTPHGALEIFAILVAATAGLGMGFALAVPGTLPRGLSLRRGAKRAVLLVLGTIPMFVVAGIIEGFVTPAYTISGGAKIAVGALTLGATLVYLLLAGRRSRPATVAGST